MPRQKPRLIIVDDIQEYLEALFGALGRDYEVVTASTLEEAKKKSVPPPDLALVDIRLSEDDMSNRDGIILLGWIKERFPNVPVVMMSAYRNFDSAVDSINLGASHFIKKPVDIRELKKLLKDLLDDKAID